MTVYQATKATFLQDLLHDQLENALAGSSVPLSGLLFLADTLSDPAIPDTSGIVIGYRIPQTSQPIDVMITGQNADHFDCAVLITLIPWSIAEPTGMDGLVSTMVDGKIGEQPHPSYRAWSYAQALSDRNLAVLEGGIRLQPCAYLYAYEANETNQKEAVIHHAAYRKYREAAPTFLRSESAELQAFIKQHILYGDYRAVAARIRQGAARSAKRLADSLPAILAGKQAFTMLDDQKVAYETALKLAGEATGKAKHVLIVQGGPGSGKTAVAMNLCKESVRLGQPVRFVSNNPVARAVYAAKLHGKLLASRIAELITAPTIPAATLVVDEAHCLDQDQIKNLIDSANCCLFFVDETQRTTLPENGSQAAIRQLIGDCASEVAAPVTELKLASQFRYNGTVGYPAWLDHVLGIGETAGNLPDDWDYDFRVVSSPQKLRALIAAKNGGGEGATITARLVAGYCWPWPSANHPKKYDITIGKLGSLHRFRARWVRPADSSSWLIQPNTAEAVGRIDDCQALELDYVGVIIGPDFVVRKGRIITDASRRAPSDHSMEGYKQADQLAKNLADKTIKNTYLSLMTRGLKGCYIYCTDRETQAYFKHLIKSMDS